MAIEERTHHQMGSSQNALEAIERAVLQISWLSQRQFMQLLDEERFRLTLPQFHTLLHLYHMSSPCKMSDLAEATQQTAASLTGVVDRLLEKHLVERSRHERDRRQVMVVVTQRGRELITEVKQVRREQLHAALTHLDAAEVTLLMEMLDQMLSGMMRVLERGEGGRWA